MQVLVTGAKGQVGQEVVMAFRHQGHHVIACGSQDLDITDEQQVAQSLKQHQDLQFIINCAAYTAVDKAESNNEQAYAINALGPKYLAFYAQKQNIPLIHLSTDYVFDGSKEGAYVEEDPVNPQNIYGKTKWQGEEFLRSICERHIILRTSWVFGRFGNNFVKTMLKLFNERPELGIVDDQQGCPTAAQDIAEVIVKMCEYNLHHTPRWGTYHYCGTPQTTWCRFAHKIYELAQLTKPCLIKAISTEAYLTPAKRPKNSVLSTEKIHRDFNIMPASWEAGLKLMLAELRKQA